MISERTAIELATILSVQNNILKRLDEEIHRINNLSEVTNAQKKRIEELSYEISLLASDSEYLEPEDFEGFDKEYVKNLFKERKKKADAFLHSIKYRNWKQFVSDCLIYSIERNLDPFASYDSFLNESDIQRIKNESYENKYKWDKYDYIVVGMAGILAALSDYFLVRIPKVVTSGIYTGQLASPITQWLRKTSVSSIHENEFIGAFVRELEMRCSVPYDAVSRDQGGLAGMTGRTHRLQSLGHDPILGFLFGVVDIFRGTLTGFSYDKLAKTHTLVTRQVSESHMVGLVEAFLIQLGHFVSDVGTSAGLPAPFFSLAQGISITNPLSKSNRTYGEMARWMYLHGYDFRHFITMGITPCIIELIVRGFVLIRQYFENQEIRISIAHNPKYRAMLLTAHTIASMGNAGKIALLQGNPLAINWAEWLAFFRYLFPQIKYLAFDRQQLKIEHLEAVNTQQWNTLVENTNELMLSIFREDYESIRLGMLSRDNIP